MILLRTFDKSEERSSCVDGRGGGKQTTFYGGGENGA